MDPIRPKKPSVVSKPAVVARPSAPAAVPARRLAVDELSRGRGQALRQANQTTLGGAAPTLDAQALIAARRASLRRPPADTTRQALAGQSSPATASGSQPLTPDEREQFFEQFGGLDFFKSRFTGVLFPEHLAELSPAEKGAYFGEVVKLGERGQFAILEAMNLGDPSSTQVAQGLGEAFRRGEISEAQLLELADGLLDEGQGPRYLLQTLLLDPANAAPGGPVEALGRALWERAGGNTESPDAFAASLALTASPELMERNLTSPNDRLLAFNALNLGAPVDGIFPGASFPLAYPHSGLDDAFQRQIHENTLRLFEGHGPELLELSANGQNESRDYRAMTAFFTNTVFNPAAHELVPNLDDRVKNVVDQYTERTLARIASGKYDSVSLAQQLGTIYGFLDAAGAEAVKRYEADESTRFDFNSLYKDLALSVLSVGVGAAAASAGPVGAAIATTVVTNAAGQVIGSPAARDYREELERRLGGADLTPGSDALRELQQAFAEGAGNLSTEAQQNLAILSGAFRDGFEFVAAELAD